MGKCEKLLVAARESSGGLRFTELCQLAECHGFVLARKRGSHCMYAREGLTRPLNFQQSQNGMAKGYQVKQLLDAIDALPGEDNP